MCLTRFSLISRALAQAGRLCCEDYDTSHAGRHVATRTHPDSYRRGRTPAASWNRQFRYLAYSGNLRLSGRGTGLCSYPVDHRGSRPESWSPDILFKISEPLVPVLTVDVSGRAHALSLAATPTELVSDYVQGFGVEPVGVGVDDLNVLRLLLRLFETRQICA